MQSSRDPEVGLAIGLKPQVRLFDLGLLTLRCLNVCSACVCPREAACRAATEGQAARAERTGPVRDVELTLAYHAHLRELAGSLF